MNSKLAKGISLFFLLTLITLPSHGRFISEDKWEGQPETAPSLHKYLYSYQNPTVYVDLDGNAPVLAEMTNRLKTQVEHINYQAKWYRNQGTVSGHAKATMMNVGAGVHAVLGGATGLLNTIADGGILVGASRFEQTGVQFNEYGIVADSRANLRDVGNSLKQAGRTAANIHRREVRAELGRGLVETGMGALNGDPDALNRLATGATTLGFGAGAGKIASTKFSSLTRPPPKSNVRYVVESDSGITPRLASSPNTQPRKYANRQNVTHRTAEDVNQEFMEMNMQSPYQHGTRVTEYKTKADDQFVRLHGEENQARSWMMRKEAIEGMTPEQLQHKYSLLEKPTYISDVNVPSGTPIRTGKVESNFGEQGGGGQGATQYELLKRLDEDNFNNKRPIGD